MFQTNYAKILAGVALSAVLSACSTSDVVEVSGHKIMQDVRDGLGEEMQVYEPVNKTITLEEAIARTLKYNLKQRLGMLSEALSKSQLEVAEAAMLPSVIAAADYSNRSKYDLSDSFNVTNKTYSSGETVSALKQSTTGSLTASWNILDFGLSYVRAKQAKNRALIARERRRKVTHELLSEVQSTYWRAYSAQELEKRAGKIGLQIAKVKRNLESILDAQLDKPVKTLRELRNIMSLELQIQDISRELSDNKSRLAALMGMLPNARIKLEPSNTELASLKVDYRKLENYALAHRSELREDEYNIRVSQDEIDASLLGMLPGVNFGAGLNASNDELTVNKQWITGTLSVGWNLMNLVSGRDRQQVAKTQLEIAKQRKLVVGSAVLLSVRLAWLGYWETLKNYRTVAEMQVVENDLVSKIKDLATAQSISETDLVRADVSNLVSAVRYHFAFSDVKDAQNRLLFSIAYDPTPEIYDYHDLQEIMVMVGDSLATWQDRVNNLNQTLAVSDYEFEHIIPQG